MMNTGKNRYRLHAATAFLTALVVLLSGCGLFKPTFESLVANMAKKLGKVTSVGVLTKVDTEFEVGLGSADLTVSGKLGAVSDMDVTKEPLRSAQTFELTLEALGQTMNSKIEQYMDQTEDKKQIIYTREEGGKWTKTVVDPSESGKDEAQEGRTDGQAGEDQKDKTGGAAGNESIFELMETAGKLKENLKNPELKKDLVTINDKEAYQTSFIMNDKLLFELARTGGTDLSRFGLDANVSSEDSVEIPAELYIYKESGLPARITADCTALSDKFISGRINDRLKGTMFEGLTLSFKSFKIDMTFDRFDEIQTIEIPQEALDAEETKSVEEISSSLFDSFGNF